jgi:prophage regulatory protein
MDRLLSKRQVRDLVSISFAHIDRKEKAGSFPRRVRPTPGRVAWVEKEIQDWIAARIAERDKPTPKPSR